MKICVIFTGGTIGSTLRDGYVNVNSKCSSELLNRYPHICFEEKHPVTMLSENVSVEDLSKIIEAIREAIEVGRHLEDGCDTKLYGEQPYDGIIVTHGTDTLCFTANVLSQVFANSPIPIALVSALLPLEDPRSNGFANFHGAVEYISVARESKLPQNAPRVLVPFKNGDEECRIHDAAYLLEADEVTGYMHSFCDMYYGAMCENALVLNPHYQSPYAGLHEKSDSWEESSNKEENANKGKCDNLERNDSWEECFNKYLSKGCISNEFLTIRSRALLNYKYFNFNFEDNKPKAILIELYHSGTLCTVGDECNALKFIEKCRQKDIIVIIGPVKRGDNVYESMRELSGNHAADRRMNGSANSSESDSESGTSNECIIAYDRSFELTVAQLALALGAGAGYAEIKKLLG